MLSSTPLYLGQNCCKYEQHKRPGTGKVCFHDKMVSGQDFKSFSEIIVFLGDFNGLVAKCAESFEGVHRENGMRIVERVQEE